MANRTKPFPVLAELRAIRDRMSKALNTMTPAEQEAFLERGSAWFRKALPARRTVGSKKPPGVAKKSPAKRRSTTKQRA